MSLEYRKLDHGTLDEITSAVISRLEGSRPLFEELPGVGDAMGAIVDDAQHKLRQVMNLSMKTDWPKAGRIPTEPEASAGEMLDDLVINLQQAEAVLSAIVDQSCLNGPDVVKPEAIITAHTLTAKANHALKAIRASGKGQPASQSSENRESSCELKHSSLATHQVVDSADRAADSAQMVMAALEIGSDAEGDAEELHLFIKAAARLARQSFGDAKEALEQATAVHEANGRR